MEIVFYSTHCPKCKVLKQKLNAKKITYTEVNDVDAMLELGIKEAPMLRVDGKFLDFVSANKFINEVNSEHSN